MVALPLRRPLAALLALCLLAGQTFATWSIVVINRRTGEICVASATCIEDFNLRSALSILAAEAGGGAAQSMISPVSTRVLINDLLLQGVPPEEILDAIEAVDNLFQSRQFGIVDLAGRAATFSGSSAADYASGITGEVGDLVYAIQGNILTGAPVLLEAEMALRNSPGDLGQRVMAAMEAAQAMGGDGRCSCDAQAPTSCGAPPQSFQKSAHVGFLVIARPGDTPFCNAFACGLGEHYMVINKAGLVATDPDPVFEMRAKFDQLRLDLDDRPDAILSEVFAFEQEVSVGSTQAANFVLSLADVDGDLITHGGATITMQHDPRSAGLSSLLQVTDLLDGTYSVEVMPGTQAGLDVLRFLVDDGIKQVTLWPPSNLLHRAPKSAPQLPAEPVQGLSTLLFARTAFPSADGLSAWILGDRGQGGELLFAERSDLSSDFIVTTDVGIANFSLASIQDFWVSADQLRMTLSALDTPGGVPHLFQTSRASTTEDFELPTLIVDLDSGLGEGGPWLSENEMELWFHTNRDGQSDLWHATRLSKDARWFPPSKLMAVSTFADERYPMLDQESTRLIFTRKSAASSLFTAQRNTDGTFPKARALSGSFPSSAHDLVAAGSTPTSAADGVQLWRLQGDGSGNRTISTSITSANSLSVSPETISLATGGSFLFQLNAGTNWANANYLILIGDAVGTTTYADLGTMPITERDFTRTLRKLYDHLSLADGSGILNASGSATANLNLAAATAIPSQLLNRELAVTFVAQSTAGILIGNAVRIQILP